MASLLSPSPSSGSSSGSAGGARRLSEMLEEKQEPFSLDLFLLDKGCSPALLDAAGAACWPRSGGVARALMRRIPAAVGRNVHASGLLRLRVILSKILRGTVATKKGGNRQQQAAIDWDGGGGKRPSNSKNGARSSPSPRRLGGAVEADMEEEEDDDDSSKQLSPVSVLEQGLFEQASPAYSQKAIVIFRELLAAAYTPALPDHSAERSSSTTATTENAPSPSTRTVRTTSSAAASLWEETLEAELAKVYDLIVTEMAAGWRVCPVGDARRHVGAELAAAVLDALTEEVAAELLLTGIDQDDGHAMMAPLTMRGVVGAGDVDICLLQF
ncbi:hypothetical protein GUJ93_ZPchr0009g589 [Zizania palustris]|uniref:DUF4378 domain-containing protein n=1 Tax=Zizania palustris TaxID=103762 RepID=A0A8J5RQW5_ZIZPA|nr:hypothetical protein GUJ93_ZPchr0009g589 [Zizania palustris]